MKLLVSIPRRLQYLLVSQQAGKPHTQLSKCWSTFLSNNTLYMISTVPFTDPEL